MHGERYRRVATLCNAQESAEVAVQASGSEKTDRLGGCWWQVRVGGSGCASLDSLLLLYMDLCRIYLGILSLYNYRWNVLNIYHWYKWQKLNDCTVCECLLAWNFKLFWSLRDRPGSQWIPGRQHLQWEWDLRVVYISAVNFHQQLSNGKGRPTRDCWDHLLEQKHVLPGNMLPLAMSNQLLLMIRRNRPALDWECGMVELRNDATMEWRNKKRHPKAR